MTKHNLVDDLEYLDQTKQTNSQEQAHGAAKVAYELFEFGGRLLANVRVQIAAVEDVHGEDARFDRFELFLALVRREVVRDVLVVDEHVRVGHGWELRTRHGRAVVDELALLRTRVQTVVFGIAGVEELRIDSIVVRIVNNRRTRLHSIVA